MGVIFAELAEDPGRIYVQAPPTYNEMMKRIPGSLYRQGAWTVPLSWAACLQLRNEFATLLDVGPGLNEWAAGYLAKRAELLDLKAGSVVYDLDTRLWSKQKEGSSWLYSVGRGLLADEPRTGKTIQVLTALRALVEHGADTLPALAVVPNSVKDTWAGEAAKWAPQLRVVVIGGTPKERAAQYTTEADLYIVNWEHIRTNSRLAGYGSIELKPKEMELGPLNLVGFKTVIADEAHRMADPKSKQTRAMWWLMWQARYRWAMTGTPVVNLPADLWSIMHGLAPEEYPPGRSKWIERYCLSGQGRFGWEVFGLNPEHMAEFHAILAPRFMRRTRAEFGGHPRQAPQIRWVELGTKQRTAYKAMQKEMIAAIDDEILVAGNPLTKRLRLSQIGHATPVIEEGEIVALTMPSAKVDALLELIDEEPDEPLIIMSPSRKLIELVDEQLQKRKHVTALITGKVDPQMRTANVARFQIGEAQFVLCTTGAGAEGITLDRANKLVFLGLDESHIKNLQAGDRGDGVMKDRAVDVIVILAKDTVDVETLANDGNKEMFLQEVAQDAQRG